METETSSPAISTRYRVRKMSSGRSSSIKWYVYDTKRKGRVTVNAHPARESAVADADDLNISDMIRDHADDPRPYEVRKAEAEAAYRGVR